MLANDRGRAQKPAAKNDFDGVVRPLLQKYCLSCHSTKVKKGSLDLERFATLDHVRKEIKPWQQMIEMLEAGEMPPKAKPQPSGDERKQLVAWVRGFLDAEARSRAGDPGFVPLRRLSNAEYDCTIRDLTGVDLRPTREFPADGAAGEGFTNAAEALSDISPALLTKYLDAAKDIAEHAVLLPDGFRFSPSKTRRDWTDESVARLRSFYARLHAARSVAGRLERGDQASGRPPTPHNRRRPAGAPAVPHGHDPAPRGPDFRKNHAGRSSSEGKGQPEVPSRAVANPDGQDAFPSARSDPRPLAASSGERCAGACGRDRGVASGPVEVRSHRQLYPRQYPADRQRPRRHGIPSRCASPSSRQPDKSEVVLYLVARDLFPDGKKAPRDLASPAHSRVPGKPPLLHADCGT